MNFSVMSFKTLLIKWFLITHFTYTMIILIMNFSLMSFKQLIISFIYFSWGVQLQRVGKTTYRKFNVEIGENNDDNERSGGATSLSSSQVNWESPQKSLQKIPREALKEFANEGKSYHCPMCDVDCAILIEYLCEWDQSRSRTRFLWRLILKLMESFSYTPMKRLMLVNFVTSQGLISISRKERKADDFKCQAQISKLFWPFLVWRSPENPLKNCFWQIPIVLMYNV